MPLLRKHPTIAQERAARGLMQPSFLPSIETDSRCARELVSASKVRTTGDQKEVGFSGHGRPWLAWMAAHRRADWAWTGRLPAAFGAARPCARLHRRRCSLPLYGDILLVNMRWRGLLGIRKGSLALPGLAELPRSRSCSEFAFWLAASAIVLRRGLAASGWRRRGA